MLLFDLGAQRSARWTAQCTPRFNVLVIAPGMNSRHWTLEMLPIGAAMDQPKVWWRGAKAVPARFLLFVICPDSERAPVYSVVVCTKPMSSREPRDAPLDVRSAHTSSYVMMEASWTMAPYQAKLHSLCCMW